MKSKTKAGVTALLSVLLAAGLLSCGGEPSPSPAAPDTSAPAGPSAQETEAGTEGIDYTAGLPDADFNEAEFRMLLWESPYALSSMHLTEETGDVLSDTVYRRNLAVEERYHIVMTELIEDESHIADTVRTTVTSGDDRFDLISYQSKNVINDAQNGYFLDICSVPTIDLSNPWWDSESNDTLKMFGKCYIAFSDMEIQPYNQLYALYFNRDMISAYDLDDPYTLVRDGKWTVDRYREMCLAVAQDINNDGKMNEADRFGTADGIGGYIMMMIGCGEGLVAEENGVYVQNYATERGISVLEKVCSVITADFNAYQNSCPFWKERFTSGNCLFANMEMNAVNGSLRDCGIALGLVPFPKYDDAQECYYSMQSNWSMGVSMPSCLSDTERAGTIIEALGAYSCGVLKQALIEVTLKDKLSRDPDMAEMIGLVIDSRFVDFGCFMEMTWGTMDFRSTLESGGTSGLASYAGSYEKAFRKKVNKMFDRFEGLS